MRLPIDMMPHLCLNRHLITSIQVSISCFLSETVETRAKVYENGGEKEKESGGE